MKNKIKLFLKAASLMSLCMLTACVTIIPAVTIVFLAFAHSIPDVTFFDIMSLWAKLNLLSMVALPLLILLLMSFSPVAEYEFIELGMLAIYGIKVLNPYNVYIVLPYKLYKMIGPIVPKKIQIITI